jgi:hypothetical protein
MNAGFPNSPGGFGVTALARIPAGQPGPNSGQGSANSGSPFTPDWGITGGGPSPPPVDIAGVVSIDTYADMRASAYDPNAVPPIGVIMLTDPTKQGVFVRATTPNTLTDNGGTRIKDSLNNIWVRNVENRVNCAWFYDRAGHYFGDGTGIQIAGSDATANPQWVGMPNDGSAYPAGSTWDYVAFMQFIYCLCADASTPGNVVWNTATASYTKNRPGFVPRGTPIFNQQVVISAAGLELEFASRQGTAIQWAGNNTGTSAIGPAFNLDSVSFSNISALYVIDTVGVSNQLVSIDHSGARPGIAPQANTFTDWAFVGVGRPSLAMNASWSQSAVALAPSGGAAQTDSQVFINLFVIGPFMDGVGIGGDNALCALFIGGNLQGCFRRGINNYGGGSYGVFNMIVEGNASYSFFSAPQITQVSMDGADFYSGSGVTSDSNTIIGVRSESTIPAVDIAQNTVLENVQVVWNAVINAWTANGHWQIGAPLAVTGNNYDIAMLVDDGGYPWFQSDPASTTTHLINPNAPGWTANQWNGFGAWLRFGSNGVCNSNSINASDANSITVAAPYTVAGSHLIKIFGVSGATAPNWLAATPFGRAARGQTGQGFTTSVGSNVVKCGAMATHITVGMYVVVCGAAVLQQASSPTQPGPLIGKVSAVDMVNFTVTLVDSLNNPVPAALTLTDVMGYWGQGITDGQLTWLPIDWDACFGIKSITNSRITGGRFSTCGIIQLDTPPAGGLSANNIRNTDPPYPTRFSYSANPDWFLMPAAISAPAGTVALANGQIGATNTIQLNCSGANITITAPLEADTLNTEFDLVLVCFNVAGITITWGTNIKATNPTLNIGNVSGLTTVCRLKWIGNRNGGGSWYVTSIQGPM